jgi:hypothetical protein
LAVHRIGSACLRECRRRLRGRQPFERSRHNHSRARSDGDSTDSDQRSSEDDSHGRLRFRSSHPRPCDSHKRCPCQRAVRKNAGRSGIRNAVLLLRVGISRRIGDKAPARYVGHIRSQGWKADLLRRRKCGVDFRLGRVVPGEPQPQHRRTGRVSLADLRRRPPGAAWLTSSGGRPARGACWTVGRWECHPTISISSPRCSKTARNCRGCSSCRECPTCRSAEPAVDTWGTPARWPT